MLKLGWVDSSLSSYAIFGLVKAVVFRTENDYYQVTLKGCGNKRVLFSDRFLELETAKTFAESKLRAHYEEYAKISRSHLPTFSFGSFDKL